MKIPPPKSFTLLARNIIESWNAPQSNYILVSPPLSRGDEVLRLLLDPALHRLSNVLPGELAIASFKSGDVVNTSGFVNSVIRQWGLDESAFDRTEDSAADLEFAIQQVCGAGRKPIIILAGFHKAIERLSWDIGAALRNLEHDYGLRTVVELPIRLSSLRERWDIFKPGVPFLASDFGQGHSTKVVASYERDEAYDIFAIFLVPEDKRSVLYELTAGIPALIPWAVREAIAISDKNIITEIIQLNSNELLGRFFKWLDAPRLSIFRNLIAAYPNSPPDQVSIGDHDWASFILNDSHKIPNIFQIAAAWQPRLHSAKFDHDSLDCNVVNRTVSDEQKSERGDNSCKLDDFPVIAIFASFWGTKHGGINSFNLEFCKIFAKNLPIGWKLLCIVPTDACIGKLDDSIEIYALRENGEAEYNAGDVSRAANMLQMRSSRLVVIGHDIKTGPYSNAVADQIRNVKKIVFSHMAYDNYYSLIGTSATGKNKVDQQRTVFKEADLVVAVGPKLATYVADQMRADAWEGTIEQFTPALLTQAPVRNARHTPKMTFIGRIEPGRDAVKQSPLAIRAMGRAISNAGILGDVMVQIIGALGTHSGEESQVKATLAAEAKRAVSCHYLEYMDDRESTLSHIRDSSLVIMPSFHEGFGLVAWEAISLGVPVVISTNSGVFQLLERLGLADKVGQIRIGGGSSPTEIEEDIQQLADVIKPRLLCGTQFHLESKSLRDSIRLQIGDGGILKFIETISKLLI